MEPVLRKSAGQDGFLLSSAYVALYDLHLAKLPHDELASLSAAGLCSCLKIYKNLGFFPSAWSFKKQLSLFFKSHESNATLGSVQQNVTGPSCWAPLGAK